ncbi:DnaJ C-terminal domain-containing protein [Demequina flava]|uniref:DnaJ C-terminal domain-containing protein n=1 Tax=Demequina flava TaxID=1095025 RepID=UPI000783C2E9|nr:DnaJ C-terminal domain-containing protein [Demequina flava]
MSSQDWFTKDFYATLGVSKDASQDEIKKAYRRLARDLHPDRNPGDAASEQRFKSVGEAYGVLSDQEQRKQYDAIRTMGGGGPRFQAGAQGGAGFEDVFSNMFGGGGQPGAQGGAGQQYRAQGFEDILSNMFGGGGYRQGPQKGADVGATTEVSFRQAALGDTISLRTSTGTVNTRLPAGVKDGQKIRIAGKGRAGTNGGPAGDLLLTIRVAKHPVFTMDGKNLKMNLPVSYDEAALGAHVDVPTLEGDRVKVKIAGGTSSGTTLRVKGRGIQTKSGTGDLLVTIQVDVPSKLGRKAKEALKAFALTAATHDPRARLYDDAAK